LVKVAGFEHAAVARHRPLLELTGCAVGAQRLF